eukprot:scaffold19500_cov23-Tisochrysis_lutea.AAC.1
MHTNHVGSATRLPLLQLGSLGVGVAPLVSCRRWRAPRAPPALPSRLPPLGELMIVIARILAVDVHQRGSPCNDGHPRHAAKCRAVAERGARFAPLTAQRGEIRAYRAPLRVGEEHLLSGEQLPCLRLPDLEPRAERTDKPLEGGLRPNLWRAHALEPEIASRLSCKALERIVRRREQ